MLLVALSVLAGCGSDGERVGAEPRLPAALAEELAARSEKVAAELAAGDACSARATANALQQRTIAAVNTGRVPPRYQEELTASVGALVASISCTITSPTAPESAAPEAEEDEEERGDDQGKKKDKKKGKGKKGGKG